MSFQSMLQRGTARVGRAALALLWLGACTSDDRAGSDSALRARALVARAQPEQQLAAIRPRAPAPDAPELRERRERGLRHHRLAQPDAALEQLLPVYRAAPADDTVAVAVAEASLWKKDTATALLVLDGLQAPDAPDALRVRGLLMEQNLRFAEAIELYERAIPRLEQPWGTLERKAQVLSWQKRFDAARATYAVVAQANEASPELRRRCRLRMAELTAWKQDLDGALAELEVLAADAPEPVDALLLAGQILEWQGKFARAKQTYSRVLEADAQHTEARARLDRLLWVD